MELNDFLICNKVLNIQLSGDVVTQSYGNLFPLIYKLMIIGVSQDLWVMYLHAQNKASKKKQISRIQAMSTENVITMLLQNLDEDINIELQNTENDLQNIWTKSLRKQRIYATRVIDNYCLNGSSNRRGHSKSAFVLQGEVLKKRTKTNRGRGRVKFICTFALWKK